MASHIQARRGKTGELGVEGAEKESIPQVSTQLESLTVSPHEQSRGGVEVGEHGGDTERAQNVGKFEMQGEGENAEIARYRQAAQQSSIDALRAAEERYNKAKEVTSEKSAQAKDALKKTSQYAGQKGGETRDTLVGAGKTTADYVVEKAVGAKDVVAETGKGTAGYVGSVATTVKDKAVVGGWGAGEYTAEKVADATKAVADVTAGAAGYVGQPAVRAKDKVGSVGVSAKDYAAHKLAAAKDAVVATEESAKDYAAKKRAEAEREMLAKQSAEAKGERHDVAGAGWQTAEAAKEPEYGREGQQRGISEAQGADGGVIHAIGETVVEIGQTTKDLLVGKGQTQWTPKDSDLLNK